MIATGGLLRINARRQDSLKSKTHKAHPHKRKNKKKRRNEVVVVKGKLKLISVSGLVAALGILVLLFGMVMAALGYWPRDGLFFRTQPHEGATMAYVSYSSSTPAPTNNQLSQTAQELETHGGGGGEGDNEEGGRSDVGFNQTEIVNKTSQQQLPQGFLVDFLERYLYSDRLKVVGPLIMGIGIFLFICANAVLHENRDKKTKVINLRDIYSTIIDLHSIHKPNSSSSRQSSANPLNGLVNYIQSKSLETKVTAYRASLLNRRQAAGGAEEGGESLTGISSRGCGHGGGDGEGGDTVFSIHKEQPEALPTPSSSQRLSFLPGFSLPSRSPCFTSMQKEVLSSVTLPLHSPWLPAPHRRHSARAGKELGSIDMTAGGEEQTREGGCHKQKQNDKEEVFRHPSPHLCLSTPTPVRPFLGSCSSSSVHRELPGGSQALLLLSSSSSLTPSHLSLSSLSHLLSPSSAVPPSACRRPSLPTTTGYSKLTHGEEESLDSTNITLSHHMTSQCCEMTSHRKYSNRESPRRLSQVDSGLRQEEEGLRRGDSH